MNINFEDALIDIVADGASNEEILEAINTTRKLLKENERKERLADLREELIEEIIDYAEALLDEDLSPSKKNEYRAMCNKVMLNAEAEYLKAAKKLDKVKTTLKDDDIISDFLRELGY